MQFKIKEPKMPTDEELVAISRGWWEMLEPHCFHKWPQSLLDASYPLRMVPLPKEIIHGMLMAADGDSDGFAKLAADFCGIVNPVLDETGWRGRFFAKLCSRSPKDYLDHDGRIRPLENSLQLLDAITSSMRCFDDLALLYYLDVAYIVLRPWVDFKPWQEWRAFIKDGKIAGISQYHYNERFEELQGSLTVHFQKMAHFIDKVVIPGFPLKDFVADIILEEKPILLEINPFGMSDPCLFREYEALNGTIRTL